jgi:RNA polymerase sigma factor (TIGR02999 family)
VYEQFRVRAWQWLDRESGSMTLQSTGLVHEAYLRLGGEQDIQWDGRGRFFAATAMRRFLERARRRQRVKHGGGLVRQAMLEEPESVDPSSTDLMALDESLHMLEKKDTRMYRLVMLRYFAGLGVDDTVSAVDISTRTVKREWRGAKVMLHHWMSEREDP